MTREIRSRWTDAVLWRGEADTVKDALHQAIAAGSNLRGSDLRGSDLRDSDLRGSNLRDSDLRGSNLRDSDLRGSDLRDSDLRGSDLRDSNLRDSNLSGSNLRDSDLRGSNLRGSNLRDSNLRGSDLRGSDLGDANLRYFRDDVWAVLAACPVEAQAVLDALRAGRVNGSAYEGECACLIGTIANARHCDYHAVPNLAPNARRPAEQWFMQIHEGDTPESHAACKQAAEWVETFLLNMRAAFGSQQAVK